YYGQSYWAPRQSSTQPHSAVGQRSSPSKLDMEPWFSTVGMDVARRVWTDTGLSRTERRLAREIWDERCDEIVRNLVDEYAWDAPFYFSNALQEHLSPDDIEAFREACQEQGTHVWYNVLMYYGEIRLAQMGVAFREPRLLTCAGCGRSFREWSVSCSQADQVGHRIHFCSDCYSQIRYPYTPEGESLPPDQMLERLAQFASALGSLPLATSAQQPDLSNLSDEKQIAIGKALLGMPAYEQYIKTFGSWLGALVQAGLLEGDVMPTPRGTRCVAADGHECYSLAEKMVDDWLSGHGITHKKEPRYPYHHPLNTTGLRSDWRVQETYIEYAGLMDEPEYAAKMQGKQELADELGLSLIVIEKEDLLVLSEKLGHLIEK
ncbi:MAG: hypothetical protein ACOC6F_03105, partial [bacterium]